MLDWDAQSFVQPSKTTRKIPVLKKINVLPLKNPVPSSQRQLKMHCSKAAKILTEGSIYWVPKITFP